MPPHVARKRHPSPTPPAKAFTFRSPVSAKKTSKAKPAHSVEDNKAFLDSIADDEDSSLSSGDSTNENDEDHDDFEDVLPGPPPKRRKVVKPVVEQNEDEEDEEMDWEDAINQDEAQQDTVVDDSTLHEPSGDLELTLDSLPSRSLGSLTNPHGTKKGPSKIERQIRMDTHRMHVQYLMFHNVVRNGWACDKDVQKILVDALTPGVSKEVERWKQACGKVAVKDEVSTDKSPKGKSKKKATNAKGGSTKRNQRDWAASADHLEEGMPNMSHGDPLLRLLKVLCGYWKKRFSTTAPGLRKQGYKELARLDEEVKSARNDTHNAAEHGEQIEDLEEFRKLAKGHHGSRDAGAQLFTALLRGLGIETRLVASLQPAGFGWSKVEEAHPPKKTKPTASKTAASTSRAKPTPESKPSDATAPNTIDISDDESELSSVPPSSDEASDLDIPNSLPKQSSPKFDRDLPFPVYWAEALSPITNTWIPIDPVVLATIGHKPENLLAFEPRGAKADRAKQVMAYVVAFSADGTAKDVTVRYLKRHVWPGKTKGMRIPPEKVPVYNKHGKVRRYEEYDWFKDVMRSYNRDSRMRTETDEMEDANELQPVYIVRETKQTAGEETLQGYKNSAEFVLERHLRREEAVLPGREPIKHFTTGKGDKAKDEPVYRRADVVPCKTQESWHKEGREVKAGEKPLKFVPYRAVTLLRKREIEEEERATGEKALQALFSRAQTDWIIPPPIEDGIIPKNAFGNMDVYVPSMVPKGAIHIPLRGTVKVCKKLGIDFAEACTGFEFGNKRAVPVLTGVVVAKENEDTVIDAWEAEEAEKQKREAAKQEKVALGMWKKMLKGLRIVERFERDYGGNAREHIAKALKSKEYKQTAEKTKPRVKPKIQDKQPPIQIDSDSELQAGGFLAETEAAHQDAGGGFLREGEDVELLEDRTHHNDAGGGFLLERDDEKLKTKGSAKNGNGELQTPMSLQSLHRDKGESDISGEAIENLEDLEDEDNSDDSEDVKAPIPLNKRTDRAAAKHSANPKKNQTVAPSESDDLSSPAEISDQDSPEAESASSEFDEGPPKPVTAPTPAKSRRAAARKSTQATRSHYFTNDSSEEETSDRPKKRASAVGTRRSARKSR